MDDFCFVHITDPHLDPRDAKSREALRRLFGRIASLTPDVVVNTGDYVAGRDEDVWRLTREAFAACPVAMLHVPGNHDVTRGDDAGRAMYCRYFGAAYHAQRVKDVLFIGLDTADDGQSKQSNSGLGPRQRQWLDAALADHERDRPRTIVVYTHMPLHYMPAGECADLVRLLTRHGVRIVLGGHRHLNRVNCFEGMLEYLTAPCIPIGKVSDAPSLRVFRWHGDGFTQTLVNLDDAAELVLTRGNQA